jgi:transposase
MNLAPSIEEFAALQQALQEAHSQRDALAGENRILRTERDLLKERLNKFMRKIFAAKSEVSGQNQKDMFFYRDFPHSQVLYTIGFLGDGFQCAA